MSTVYRKIAIDCLERGRYQPRLHFDPVALQELAQSISTQGLIEPLIVREIAKGRYEIIAGERRWRAAMLAQMHEIPCLIGQYSDAQAAALTLVENIQRQELNLVEEASGYQRLRDEFRFQQDEIAALVGKSRSHVANLLRLLGLCFDVKQMLITSALTLGHARLLVNLPPEQQRLFAEDMVKNEWSVRTSEEKIKAYKSKPSPQTFLYRDRDIKHLEAILAEQVGAPVQITCEKEQGGWLQVKFFDNDTLAGLLERMGLRYD